MRVKTIKSEERAIEVLAGILGKDWRSRAVTYLAAETSPSTSVDFAESFGITVQSAVEALQALQVLDLVTPYNRLISSKILETAGDYPRKYYLLGELQAYDCLEFKEVEVANVRN